MPFAMPRNDHFLPRQARDKHRRKTLRKEWQCVFLQKRYQSLDSADEHHVAFSFTFDKGDCFGEVCDKRIRCAILY
jgi:hypothetical protein